MKMTQLLLAAALCGLCIVALAAPSNTGLPTAKAPAGASVHIISPREGATVTGPVTVRFGLKGMGWAGGVSLSGACHHHLLADVTRLPLAGRPILSDAHHRHFGAGQTQTTLHLAPGDHTLQLELADARYLPFDPALRSERIPMHVK